MIADSHDTCLNLLAEKLDPRAHLIKGTLRRFSMMEGVDQSFDRVFLVGYHTRAGIAGSQMDHTFSNRIVRELKVGDRLLGETELSALVAGYYRVPVALVTGDQALETEVQEALPWAVFCRTKTALSRYAALSAHPEKVRALLAEKAREATEKERKSLLFYTLPSPCTVEVTLHHAAMVDAVSVLPCYERMDGRTLSFRAANALELYRYFVGMVRLASTAV